MPYRFKRNDKSVEAGVRRIASEQAARMGRDLGDKALDPAEIAFRLRKRTKKLRALLRLIGPEFEGYDFENAALRNAARRLGPLRDASAMLATLDALGADWPQDEIGALRRALGAEETPEEALAAKALVDEFGETLAGLVDRIAGWQLSEEGFEAIEEGLVDGYRQMRRGLKAVRLDSDEEALHEWRKAVKTHWLHLRLLQELAPQMTAPYREGTEGLAQILGEHQNLAILAARLEAPELVAAAGARLEDILSRLAGRQHDLVERAMAIGKMLTAEKPKALGQRLEHYWDDWHDGMGASAVN